MAQLNQPSKQLKLKFSTEYLNKKPTYSDPEDKPVAKQLSAALFTDQGKYIWLAADEEIAIERLEKSDREDVYKNHKRFALEELLDGFDPKQKEVDIEGLDYDGQYLWLVGSHSSKRKKAKNNPLADKDLTVDKDGNRYLLARIPMNDGELVLSTGTAHSAVLKRGVETNELMQVLAEDPYLKDIISCNLPGKDNGFDIEGFIIQNNKVLIGLRGPVLRGVAIIVEIELEDESEGTLRLKTLNINDKRYKLHFLELDGLGIRELCLDGNNLLILAGPTMDLDGSFKLFRLENPFTLEDSSLAKIGEQLKLVLEIPHGFRNDRAEGVTLYPDQTSGKSILVVYDTPNPERLGDENFTVLADLFSLP